METVQQVKKLLPRKKETGDNQLSNQPMIWTFRFGKHKDTPITTVIQNDPDYIERQRLSSKTHYYKHKQEVLERMKRYQQNKLELAQIEMLHELQK